MNEAAISFDVNTKNHQIGTIKMAELEKSIGELSDLFAIKQTSAQAYTDAVKRVSQKSGIDPQVIKTYIAAIMNDKLEELHERAEQLSLVFEEGPGQ